MYILLLFNFSAVKHPFLFGVGLKLYKCISYFVNGIKLYCDLLNYFITNVLPA
jgi:hypothetical protein